MTYVNRPDHGFFLSFDDPNDPAVTPTYVDFSLLLKRATAISRGRQYELGQTLAASPDLDIRDVNEYLNSANTSSPYSPNVDSYRRALWMCTWPNTTVGNLFNPAYWGIAGTVDANLGPRDPSFESYTVGAAVGWISAVSTTPVVAATLPHSGTQNLRWTVAATVTQQGASFGMRCMPGRYYTISVWLRQSSASTQNLLVDAVTGQTTTTSGSYVRLSQTFLATAPEHIAYVVTSGVGVVGTVDVDDIQMEQQPALNANADFQFGTQAWTPHGPTIAPNSRYAHKPEQSLRLTPDGVAVTPYVESDKVPAVAGQSYIASGWIYSPTGTGSNLADIRVNWYNAGGGIISNPAGSPSAVTAGVWKFYSTTFVAPALTAFVTVLGTLLSTPVVANVVYLDQVQVVSTTATTFTTTGPTVYPVMANFAERFQKYWENQEYTGKVQVPCVDALTALSATKIPTEYNQAVHLLSPAFFWTLQSGVSTSTVYPDTSGNQGPSLAPWAGKYGAGSGVAPGTSMAIVGDPGATGVGFVSPGLTPGQQNAGTILAAGLLNRNGTITIPPAIGTSWATSVALWVQNTPTSPTSFSVPFIAGAPINNPGSGGDIQFPLRILIWNTGVVEAKYGALDSTGTFQTLSTGLSAKNINDSKPHLMIATITQVSGGNTVITLYVDNVAITSATTTAALGGMLRFGANTVEVGGSFTRTVFDQMMNGPVTDVAIWNRALSSTEAGQLWTAGGLGRAGELAGVRLARHFTYGGYPQPYRISTNTTTTMGPPSYFTSIDLGSDAQNTAMAEGGNFWIAPDGAPVFESRQDRWLRLTPLWTLGNGGGASHFSAPEMDTDPTYVYANVYVGRNGGGVAQGGLSADVATAVKKYFGRTYGPIGLDFQTDQQAQDQANWTFYTHNHTLQRVASITLDPASNPTLWPLVLGIEVGNRIRIVFTSPAANGGTGFTYTQDFFVETVNHEDIDMDAGTWTTSLLASPIGASGGVVTMQPFILNDATWGVLGQNILGW